MVTGAPVAEAPGITNRFGSTVALHEASIRIETGQTHALVGRNGAGKSTLVSVLTGLQAPDEGAVGSGGVVGGDEGVELTLELLLRARRVLVGEEAL